MEYELAKAVRRAILTHATDLEARFGESEWDGTGLCPEAQADGVPCQEAGRSCDVCGRRTPERPQSRS